VPSTAASFPRCSLDAGTLNTSDPDPGHPSAPAEPDPGHRFTPQPRSRSPRLHPAPDPGHRSARTLPPSPCHRPGLRSRSPWLRRTPPIPVATAPSGPIPVATAPVRSQDPAAAAIPAPDPQPGRSSPATAPGRVQPTNLRSGRAWSYRRPARPVGVRPMRWSCAPRARPADRPPTPAPRRGRRLAAQAQSRRRSAAGRRGWRTR
jgi:hypothetical protein